MAVDVRSMTGAEIATVLSGLAQLRITVFHDWPYLYDGDVAYEERYLARYAENPQAVLVGAFDGDDLIGAATGMPLSAHEDASALSLPEGAPPASDIYYCAESVLLPAYRGLGLGHAFFDGREAQARAGGFGHTAFASVLRPDDHPAKPEGYRPLHGFWKKRGYAPLPGAVARFSWTDRGETAETEKELQVWMRSL